MTWLFWHTATADLEKSSNDKISKHNVCVCVRRDNMTDQLIKCATGHCCCRWGQRTFWFGDTKMELVFCRSKMEICFFHFYKDKQVVERFFFFVTWISKTCFNKSFEQYVSHRNITLPFLCLFLCLLLLVVLGSMLIIITIRTKGRMALWLLTGVIRLFNYHFLGKEEYN